MNENTFILNMSQASLNMSVYQSVWLGGVDTIQNDWRWLDGSRWDFTNWGPNEPDNNGGLQHCLEMYTWAVSAIDCFVI
jgi:hypothetical protein